MITADFVPHVHYYWWSWTVKTSNGITYGKTGTVHVLSLFQKALYQTFCFWYIINYLDICCWGLKDDNCFLFTHMKMIEIMYNLSLFPKLLHLTFCILGHFINYLDKCCKGQHGDCGCSFYLWYWWIWTVKILIDIIYKNISIDINSLHFRKFQHSVWFYIILYKNFFFSKLRCFRDGLLHH